MTYCCVNHSSSLLPLKAILRVNNLLKIINNIRNSYYSLGHCNFLYVCPISLHFLLFHPSSLPPLYSLLHLLSIFIFLSTPPFFPSPVSSLFLAPLAPPPPHPSPNLLLPSSPLPSLLSSVAITLQPKEKYLPRKS